ncbi:aminotransferase class-III [Tanacetum coccineum]
MWAVDPSRVLKALAESLSIRIIVFNAKDEILTEFLPTLDAEIEFTAYVLCAPTMSNVTKAYSLEAALPILTPQPTNNNAPEEVLGQNRISLSQSKSDLVKKAEAKVRFQHNFFPLGCFPILLKKQRKISSLEAGQPTMHVSVFQSLYKGINHIWIGRSLGTIVAVDLVLAVVIVSWEVAKEGQVAPPLCSCLGCFLCKFWMDADELDLMIARPYTSSHDIISLRNKYHGNVSATMAATAQHSYKYNVVQTPLLIGSVRKETRVDSEECNGDQCGRPRCVLPTRPQIGIGSFDINAATSTPVGLGPLQIAAR